jgi:hypothetical protein
VELALAEGRPLTAAGCAVKEIEEFEVGAELHSFAEIEALIAQQFAVERIVFDD